MFKWTANECQICMCKNKDKIYKGVVSSHSEEECAGLGNGQ